MRKFGEKEIISYATVGFPNFNESEKIVQSFINAGSKIIELGLPCKNPYIDGDVIKKTHEIAQRNGASLTETLAFAEKITKNNNDVIFVFFCYWDSIKNEIQNEFAQKVKNAGFSAILLVDLPEDEKNDFKKKCQNASLKIIALLNPEINEEMYNDLIDESCGFIYYAMFSGTTGIRNSLPENLAKKIQQIKKKSALPVVCGFGVSNASMAQEVLKIGDGVVIGSILMRYVLDNKLDAAITLLKNI